MKTIIYAASDASIIEVPADKFISPPTTFSQSCKTYRRLTPEYYAWFTYKYHILEDALTNGYMSPEAFKYMMLRIAKIYDCAVAQFGRETLREAIRTTDVRKYDDMIKRESETNHSGKSISIANRNGHASIVCERKRA